MQGPPLFFWLHPCCHFSSVPTLDKLRVVERWDRAPWGDCARTHQCLFLVSAVENHGLLKGPAACSVGAYTTEAILSSSDTKGPCPLQLSRAKQKCCQGSDSPKEALPTPYPLFLPSDGQKSKPKQVKLGCQLLLASMQLAALPSSPALILLFCN